MTQHDRNEKLIIEEK